MIAVIFEVKPKPGRKDDERRAEENSEFHLVIVFVELKTGACHYEWFDPANGASAGNGETKSSASQREFKAPFEGDALLFGGANRSGTNKNSAEIPATGMTTELTRLSECDTQ